MFNVTIGGSYVNDQVQLGLDLRRLCWRGMDV